MREWENNFRQVNPYVPGEQPQVRDIIKLNTNENPYPPAPKVNEALQRLNLEQMKLYPDYQCTKLIEAISKTYQIPTEKIFVGVGSDDVLSVAFLSFFNSKTPILFPDITYSFYKVWAELYQIPYECPRVDENFRIRKEDYYKKNGGIVLANPNAPTSICESVEWIRDILRHNQESVVIVDEAYIDFGGESVLPLIDEFENLLVVQTYSKSKSMAGMRIGYAMGNPHLIQALNDVKYSINSYTMNTTALMLGEVAMYEQEYYKSTVQKIIDTREAAKVRMKELGFGVLDSKTNFLFVTHKEVPAKKIFEALKAKNIFVRYFENGRIDNFLRITIGTTEEMEALYRELELILG